MDQRLLHHLASWLGQWPPLAPLQVVGSGRRRIPGWDRRPHPMIGVGCPGGLILSVSPAAAPAVRRAIGIPHPDDPADDPPPRAEEINLIPGSLPALVGFPERRLFRGTFRWTTDPAPLPDAGVWLPADDPVVPDWLAVFDRHVLVARDADTGAYLAGVGVKRHSATGCELAVGTAAAVRGLGLARRLVAQAARRMLDEGRVPTYVHDPRNTASARVADAAGFPDRGWTYRDLTG